MTALIQALEQRGFGVATGEYWNGHWPTGVFTLGIAGLGYGGGRSRWRDTRWKRLEEQLNSFVTGMIEAAAEIVETAARDERDRRRRLVVDDAKRRREYRNQRESVRIGTIDGGADKWDYYLRLTRYISAVEQMISNATLSETEATRCGEWLRWARAYAKKCNPLRTGPPTLRVEPHRLEEQDPRWFRAEYSRLRDSGLGRRTSGNVAGQHSHPNVGMLPNKRLQSADLLGNGYCLTNAARYTLC